MSKRTTLVQTKARRASAETNQVPSTSKGTKKDTTRKLQSSVLLKTTDIIQTSSNLQLDNDPLYAL